MSTIAAQNYGDGIDSVPASAVLEGTAKATFAAAEPASLDEGYNIASMTDIGLGHAVLNLTAAVTSTTTPMAGCIRRSAAGPRILQMSIISTSEFRALTYGVSGGAIEDEPFTGCIFGEFA